jgi:hypothetical protein
LYLQGNVENARKC